MNEKLNVTRLPPPKKFPNNPGAREDILAGARAALEADAPLPPVGREPEQVRQLGLEEIQVYENNPRTTRNTQFDDIKEALRTEGLGKVLLHVTKRPGESIYTLSFGGGTRFQAIQELWNETGDERFRAVRCLIQPFKSDIALQANHLIENNQRGEMTFWNNAKAFIKIYLDINDSNGTELSSRDFIDQCNTLGLRVNRTTFNFFQFAVKEFSAFGFASELSRTAIERIQPQFAAYDRLAALKGDVNITPGIQGVMGRLDAAWEGRTFELNKLLQGTDLAVSTALGLAMMEMPKAIEYSKDKYTNTWEKMLARLRNTTPPAPKPPTAVAIADVLPSIEEVHARIAGTSPMPVVTLPKVRDMPPTYPLNAPAGAVATPGVDLVEHIFNLAMTVCDSNALEKHIYRCDTGFGWYMEPITSAEIYQEKPDLPNRFRFDLWSILAQLSGQWHEDVYLTLPEKSLWRRVLSKQPGVTNDERQAVAAVPPAHTAYAHFVLGSAPWGTRMYYCETLNSVEHASPHDALVALMFCQFQLMREQPERFAHIRVYGRGEPRQVKTGDWE